MSQSRITQSVQNSNCTSINAMDIFNNLDLARLIMTFVDPKATLPIVLTSKYLQGVLGKQSLLSDIKYFVNSIEMVRFAEKMSTRKAPFPRERICRVAASLGHLEVLAYLRAAMCPWGLHILPRVALAGHLHILQWISQESSSPADLHHTFTYSAAAR
jgi:hypothetical protein